MASPRQKCRGEAVRSKVDTLAADRVSFVARLEEREYPSYLPRLFLEQAGATEGFESRPVQPRALDCTPIDWQCMCKPCLAGERA